MIRVLLVLVLMSGLLSQAAMAAMEPQALIKDVADRTIDRLNREKAVIEKDPARLHSLIDEIILPHFDFERMSKWVLGRNWVRASAEERQGFMKEFKTLLVRTYASSLSDFAQQKIVYLPFKGDLAAKEVTVESEVEQPGGFPIPITYRLHKKGKDWKAFDVTIDGISLVANYRTSFAREIRADGMSGLIKTLADKNAESR